MGLPVSILGESVGLPVSILGGSVGGSMGSLLVF